MLFNVPYRQSYRLSGWDYRSPAYYFITICTRGGEVFFGEIRNEMMGLNEVGCIAAKYWQSIPDHFQNVELDAWVVMPNHVHGILFLNKIIRTDVALLRPYELKNNYFSRIAPKAGSLSTIIRSYKSTCTKTINSIQNKMHFGWHGRFYDRIIRSEEELQTVRQYIRDNPAKWHRDRNNPDKMAIW